METDSSVTKLTQIKVFVDEFRQNEAFLFSRKSCFLNNAPCGNMRKDVALSFFCDRIKITLLFDEYTVSFASNEELSCDRSRILLRDETEVGFFVHGGNKISFFYVTNPEGGILTSGHNSVLNILLEQA